MNTDDLKKFALREALASDNESGKWVLDLKHTHWILTCHCENLVNFKFALTYHDPEHNPLMKAMLATERDITEVDATYFLAGTGVLKFGNDPMGKPI